MKNVRAFKKLAFLGTLLLVMLIGLLPQLSVNALSDDPARLTGGPCGDELTWTLDSDYVLTISGEGTMPDYKCVYDGAIVPYIHSPWIEYRYMIKKIVIEEGVTSIGTWAFNECKNVEEVVLPESLTSIGMGAFYYCQSVEEIHIPRNLQFVGELAFTVCLNLKKVHITDLSAWCKINYDLNGGASTPLYYGSLYFNGELITDLVIPEDVTHIGDYAFSGMSSITNITLHEGVTSIGQYAFSGCGISSIMLPEKLESIGAGAFDGSQLCSVEVPKNVKTLEGRVFSNCQNLECVILPDGLTTISNGLFAWCDELNTVYIPDSVTSVGNDAFYGCTALTDIDLPEGIIEIGNSAFSQCVNLEDIRLPEKLATIGNNAFKGCAKMTKLEFPELVVTIGSGAFSDCVGLREVYVANIESWCNINFLDAVANPMCYANQLYIGNVPITEAVIPDSVYSINDYAFYNCAQLKKIVFGKNVESIGKYAFYGCTNLKNVELVDATGTIGDRAFAECASLNSITICADAVQIGDYAFLNCKALENVYFEGDAPIIGTESFRYVKATCWYPKGNETYTLEITTEEFGGDLIWTYEGENIGNQCGDQIFWEITENGTLILSGSGAMYDYAVDEKLYAPWYESRGIITAVEISDGITHIGDGAFYNCTAIKNIVWGDGLKSVGNKAFQGCTGLKSVEIPAGVTTVGEYAFYGCSYITSAVLPDSLTYIPNYMFAGCNRLVNVTLPKRITSIGDSAFSACFGLSSLVLPEGLTTIGKNAFSMCGAYSMYGDYYPCSNFTSVTFPSTLVSIGYGAFSRCEMLTSIEIPDNVTTIGDYAFSYCYKLKTVTISANIESIGADAFFQCKKMTTITFKWNAPSIGSSALDTTQNTTCYYPANNEVWSDSVVSAYKKAQSSKLIWVPMEMEEPEEGSGGNAGEVEGDNSGENGGTDDEGSENGDGNVSSDGEGNEGGNSGSGNDSGNGSGNGGSGSGSGGSGTGSETCEHVEATVVTAPTCTEGGYTTHTCTKCGAYYYSNRIEALGHSYEEGICTVCGDAQPGPVITQQPVSVETVIGNRFAITVKAEGEGLTYQWYYKDAGMKNFAVSSNKTSSYAYTMQSYMHNRQVYCVITDQYGNSVTTEIATITRPPMELTILEQPKDVQTSIGQKFSVSPKVQGDGLTYQWYYKDAGMKNFAVSSNKTSAYAYTMQSYMHNRQVYCVITDQYGNSVTTEIATITRPPVELTILEQPKNVQTPVGQKFSVSPKVQGDGLTYQWYYKDAGMKNFAISSNKTSAYAYTMQSYMHNRQVYCVITDQYGNSVTTEIATITRPPVELKLLNQPTDVYAAKGEKFAVSFKVQGDGLTYQWYYKDAGMKNFAVSSNKTSAYAYTMQSYMNNRQVYCVITDQYGNQVITEVVTLVLDTN